MCVRVYDYLYFSCMYLGHAKSILKSEKHPDSNYRNVQLSCYLQEGMDRKAKGYISCVW